MSDATSPSDLSASGSGNLGRALKGLVLLVLALILAKVLVFHARLISYPYPLDLSEPAQALLAQGVAEGRSTGDLAQLPGLSNHYGPLYSLVTGFLWAHGLARGLPGQRLFCALCLALILGLFVLNCRRLGTPWPHTLALALWIYELLLIHFTPVSRPDALGLLFWFAGLSLPFLLGEGVLVLVLSAALFALAGLTKVYFLCGPVFLGLGLLSRPRVLIRFVAVETVVLGLAFAWLHQNYPYDLYVSVLNQTNNLNFDQDHMLLQLWVVLVLASPAFILLLALGALGGVAGPRVGAQDREGPFGAVWGLYGALGLVLFVFLFGGAQGGLFTYLIQLSVLPFGVFFAGVCGAPGRGRVMGPVLLAALFVNVLGGAKVALHHGFDPGSPVLAQWQKVDAVVRAARRPVVSSDLALQVNARGLPVYDTGLSDFTWVTRVPHAGWKAWLFPRIGALKERHLAWQERSVRALSDPGTDLVEVTDYGHYDFGPLLNARYRFLGKIQIGYPQCGWATYWLSFYAPKPAPGPKQGPH